MKQEQDKWYKDLRDHMKDYAEPVPADVWDSLEKELKAPSYIHRRFVMRMLAAAVVCMALLSSVTYYLLFSPADEYIRNQNNNFSQEIIPKENKPFAKEQSNLVVEEDILSDVLLQPSLINKTVGKKEHAVLTPKETEEVSNEKEEVFEERYSEHVETIEEKGNTEVASTSSRTSSNDSRQRYNWSIPPQKKKEKRWGTSLLMGNIPASNSTNIMPGTGSLYSAPSSMKTTHDNQEEVLDINLGNNKTNDPSHLTTAQEARQNVLMNASREVTETNVKHKMPVTVGLSFRYGLTEKIALESGLLYTYLSSEVSSSGSMDYYIDTYKFHYLGIPLKANWTFLNKKYYSFYVSGGGTLEKCVSGKEISKNILNGEMVTNETNNLPIKPLQFSLSAAAGVQFNLTNQFGVYLEPGVVHYFDDGSKVETIRKDKPTNFNIQVGLRFNY